MLSHNLSVDPIDLRMSSDHLAMHQGELLATHAAADRVIAEAQAHWIGAAAAALAAERPVWRSDSDLLIADLAEQCAKIRCAADHYAMSDDDAARAVGRLR